MIRSESGSTGLQDYGDSIDATTFEQILELDDDDHPRLLRAGRANIREWMPRRTVTRDQDDSPNWLAILELTRQFIRMQMAVPQASCIVNVIGVPVRRLTRLFFLPISVRALVLSRLSGHRLLEGPRKGNR